MKPVGYVDVGPMRMYFDELGAPGNPTLVLLHGGGGDVADPVGGWAALVDQFAEHFHVVAVDHRGHGRTANPAEFMSFTQLGDDLNALISHLDVGAVHLAGISDGGVMVLDQALRRPDTVRSGVVIGTNYCVDEQTLAAASGIDVEALERDHPTVAAVVRLPARRREVPGLLEGPDPPDHRQQRGQPDVDSGGPGSDPVSDAADRR